MREGGSEVRSSATRTGEAGERANNWRMGYARDQSRAIRSGADVGGRLKNPSRSRGKARFKRIFVHCTHFWPFNRKQKKTKYNGADVVFAETRRRRCGNRRRRDRDAWTVAHLQRELQHLGGLAAPIVRPDLRRDLQSFPARLSSSALRSPLTQHFSRPRRPSAERAPRSSNPRGRARGGHWCLRRVYAFTPRARDETSPVEGSAQGVPPPPRRVAPRGTQSHRYDINGSSTGCLSFQPGRMHE